MQVVQRLIPPKSEDLAIDSNKASASAMGARIGFSTDVAYSVQQMSKAKIPKRNI